MIDWGDDDASGGGNPNQWALSVLMGLPLWLSTPASCCVSFDGLVRKHKKLE